MLGVRMALLAFLTLSVGLAGCLGDGGDAMTRAPVIPPCTLSGGTIDWPVVAGAPAPTGPVQATLKTDAYSVTHIYADDAYSLWYANGYVQGRDRLFEIDALRMIGRGESARYLGPGQLGSDIEVNRELYTADEIEAQWQAAPADAQQVLQAYADGVNRFIVEAIAQNALPSEFAAVGRVPPQWTPQDSVAVIDYLIGFFGVDGGYELQNLQTLARLQQTVGDEAWDALGDITWLRDDDTYTTIAPEQQTFNGCEDPLSATAAASAGQLGAVSAALDAVTLGGDPTGEIGAGLPFPARGYDPTPGEGLMAGFHWGSNALLVDGSHTDTGVPIMWGAPQMGYYKPPIPYQVGLHGAGYDAVGIGVAGAPGIVIGRNAELAWTATSGIEDQVDLVQLELTGPREYLWDGQERAMECWTVTHQTSPTPADFATFPDVQPPMTYAQEVCRADGWPVVAINEEAGVAWAKHTTTRNEELMGALKWLQAPTAHSLDGFRQIMSDFPFTFNFHVASADGVLYLHTGDVPLRAAGIDPRLPTPSGSAYAWTGEAYTGDMGVWATDPSRGYFANWNNAPGYGWRAGDQPTLWGPVHRVQQIEYQVQKRLAANGGILSFEDVADLNWQAATHDSLALPVLPHLIAAADTEDLAAVRQELSSWLELGAPWRDDDDNGFYDDPAHAVWDAFFMDIVARIEGDELGDLTPVVELDPKLHSDVHAGDHGTLNNKLTLVLKAFDGDTAHDWCDDITTGAVETCKQQVQASLRAAMADLGSDPAGWKTEVHTSRFTPIGGTDADEMPMINKGSWVQVVSLAEPGRSMSALPPSNTGLLTAPELALMIATGVEPARLTSELDMYWSGQFKPFPLTPDEVDAVAVSTGTLLVLAVPSP